MLFACGFLASMFDNEKKTRVLSILSLIGAVFCSIPAINVLLNKNILSFKFFLNDLFGMISFKIDTLSAFFILVISVMSILAVFYSNEYLKPYLQKGKNINNNMFFLTMMIAAMLLVVTCQNALFFLISWEIMSLSSFFLVIFEHEKKEVIKAGIKYLVFMHISVLFIIIAFALSSINANSLDFVAISNSFNNNLQLANIVFVLSFIGFGIKAGYVPFHNWLPDAHPAAPSHVSAVMSGVMIKTGIYGILRMLTLLPNVDKGLAYFVLIIAVISGLYGVLYAITQRDIKKLLAYCSIENIAIISIGIGIGMLGLSYNAIPVAVLGFSGAILHVLNHSIFKELLFFGAGNIYIKTHTKNMEQLGGLIKKMPVTAFMFLIGSIAICGLPPFNGFISEFLIYMGMIKSFTINNFFCILAIILSLSSLALIGSMAILCFTKAFSIIFLGAPRSEVVEHVDEDVSKKAIMPMAVLVLFIFLIGLFPQYVLNGIFLPVEVLIGEKFEFSSTVMQVIQIISFISLLFLLTVGILVFIKYRFSKGKIFEFETWGCGYNKPNNRMQYTGSSYSKPFVVVLRPFFKKIFDVVRPKKLFPTEAHYLSQIDDIEEAYFINPLVKLDEKFLSKFEKLQDGNLQMYIQYGLWFLVFVLVLVFVIK